MLYIVSVMIAKQQLKTGLKVQVKLNGQPITGIYRQWSSKYDMAMVEVGGRVLPRKIYSVHTDDSEPVNGHEVQISEPIATPVERVPINTRFHYLEELVKVVATTPATSMLITGQGGLGKSYTVLQVLDSLSFEEDHDYVLVRGFVSPRGLFKLLYKHSDKLVIFDDTDSVLKNPVALNLLKSALDTTRSRRINWTTNNSEDGELDHDIPGRFDFEGKIIFISNMHVDKIDRAVRSRAMVVDLEMTKNEVIERMRAFLPGFQPEIDMSAKIEAVDLIDEMKDKIGETFLTLRTLIQVINLRLTKPENWRELSRYLVVAAGQD